MNVQSFDYSVDLLDALQWADNLSTDLPALLQAKSDWYAANFTQFWTDWEKNVFDLRSANEFGLSVWAQILCLPLVVATGTESDGPAWGFGALAVSGNQNFAHGNFKGTSGSGGLNVTLDQKRQLLQLWAFRLRSRGDVWSVNDFLARIGLHCYVRDNCDMTAAYVFTVDPGQTFREALLTYDLLPRPCGVTLTIEAP